MQLPHLQMGVFSFRDRAKPEFAELGTDDTRHCECGFSRLINGLVEPPVLHFGFQTDLTDFHATVSPAQSDRACERIVQEIDNVVAADQRRFDQIVPRCSRLWRRPLPVSPEVAPSVPPLSRLAAEPSSVLFR